MSRAAAKSLWVSTLILALTACSFSVAGAEEQKSDLYPQYDVEVQVIRTNETAEKVFLKRIKATKTKEVLKLKDLQILDIAYNYCPDRYTSFEMKNVKLNKLYKTYSIKYLCRVPKQVQVDGGFQTVWVANTTK